MQAKFKLIDVARVSGRDEYPITNTITQIGRIDQLIPGVEQIVIAQDTISRYHAVIEYKNNAFWVMDQGSSNGTKLNNVKLTTQQQLKSCDVLQFDRFKFIFQEITPDNSDATLIEPIAQAQDGDATVLEPIPQEQEAQEMSPAEFDQLFTDIDKNRK